MKKTACVVIALALANCAGAPRWTKDGVSPETAAADYADCQSQAQAATTRDTQIESDILASRGPDWQKWGTLSTHQAVFAAENHAQTDDIIKGCMIGKGYAPGG